MTELGKVIAVVCFAISTATAQTSAPPRSMFLPTPPPEQAHSVALQHPASSEGEPEQWETFMDDQTVRNVTSPTLTPVVPDPAKSTGLAVIVAPGGAFMYLSFEQEGNKVAAWLAEHGIAAFILKYRTRPTPRDPSAFQSSLMQFMQKISKPGEPIPDAPADALDDAKAAVKLVRAQAANWRVDPKRVGFLGFSAGAMLAISLGLDEDRAALPDFIAPIYGAISPRPATPFAPPMFFAVALDDSLIARGTNLSLVDAWRSAGRPVEVHLFERGGHGFAMRGRTHASGLWADEFYAWLSDSGFLRASK